MAAVPDRARQAFRILHVGFVVAPVLAGLDKFFDVLVDWDRYLAPVATDVLPVSAHTIMVVVGVIEIAAGVLVMDPGLTALLAMGLATYAGYVLKLSAIGVKILTDTCLRTFCLFLSSSLRDGLQHGFPFIRNSPHQRAYQRACTYRGLESRRRPWERL